MSAPAEKGREALIPQRVPKRPRWSHGYEFSLTTKQLDDVRDGRARTAGPDEDFGAGPSVRVDWDDVGPFRLLATIEVLLEEIDALRASQPPRGPGGRA